MKKISFVALVVLVATAVAIQPHEDSYYVTFGRNHTLVRYKANTSENPVSNCKIDPAKNITIAKTGMLSKKDQENFLKIHDLYRRFVAKGEQPNQPEAANMEKVRWDEELAAAAQRWAEQCPGKNQHDSNRVVDAFVHVGQNIYVDVVQSIAPWHPEPGFDAPALDAIKSWYHEVSNFDPALIENYQIREELDTERYSQLLWATSSSIGCGFFMRRKAEDKTDHVVVKWKRWVVCNYGPGGNIVGAEMYKVGPAGSQCPAGKSNKDGLCA